jgi:hypothetical protein
MRTSSGWRSDGSVAPPPPFHTADDTAADREPGGTGAHHRLAQGDVATRFVAGSGGVAFRRGDRHRSRGYGIARRRKIVAVAAALTLPLGLVAACGSDDTSSTTGTSVALADCPFSGTAAASQGGQPAANAAVLDKLTTSKSGCIDSLAFEFSTPPPAWTVEYAPGPFVDAANVPVSVPGPATLVVTFAATTYANHPTPTTASTSNLDYVKAINVITAPNGSLQWILSLAEQAQYQTSSSEVPSNFTLAVG